VTTRSGDAASITATTDETRSIVVRAGDARFWVTYRVAERDAELGIAGDVDLQRDAAMLAPTAYRLALWSDVARLLVAWDLEVDRAPLPVTTATVARLPLAVLEAIVGAIAADRGAELEREEL
jgi:hypothetical protein